MYLQHLTAIGETGVAYCIFESGKGGCDEIPLYQGIGKKCRGEELPSSAGQQNIHDQEKYHAVVLFFLIL